MYDTDGTDKTRIFWWIAFVVPPRNYDYGVLAMTDVWGDCFPARAGYLLAMTVMGAPRNDDYWGDCFGAEALLAMTVKKLPGFEGPAVWVL